MVGRVLVPICEDPRIPDPPPCSRLTKYEGYVPVVNKGGNPLHGRGREKKKERKEGLRQTLVKINKSVACDLFYRKSI